MLPTRTADVTYVILDIDDLEFAEPPAVTSAGTIDIYGIYEPTGET